MQCQYSPTSYKQDLTYNGKWPVLVSSLQDPKVLHTTSSYHSPIHTHIYTLVAVCYNVSQLTYILFRLLHKYALLCVSRFQSIKVFGWRLRKWETFKRSVKTGTINLGLMKKKKKPDTHLDVRQKVSYHKSIWEMLMI